MSLAKYSLDNTKIIYFFLAVLLIGGITSFGKLGTEWWSAFRVSV
ncbi:hypothetical protein [Bacteroides acidifaciens]|nr:hypothetical protein [Bacteroides acidifaciens]